MKWTIEYAQENLENLIDLAIQGGAQYLTRHGEPAVVINSEGEYQQLKGRKRSLKDYLLNGPDLTGVDVSRDPSPMREFDVE
jgi:prevent-host-death family protein